MDTSRSMKFGKGKKDEQSVKIAATLAYLSVCSMDKVSVYVIKDKKVHDVIIGMSGKESLYRGLCSYDNTCLYFRNRKNAFYRAPAD